MQRRSWHNRADGTTAQIFSTSTITSAIIHAGHVSLWKRSENAADIDERMEATLKDLHKKVFQSVCEAAKAHKVAESTLQERHSRGKSRE